MLHSIACTLPPACAALLSQDFSGFRLLVLLPRERVMWPAPGQYDKPEAKKHPKLGAPLDPLPQLMVRPGCRAHHSFQTPLTPTNTGCKQHP